MLTKLALNIFTNTNKRKSMNRKRRHVTLRNISQVSFCVAYRPVAPDPKAISMAPETPQHNHIMWYL